MVEPSAESKYVRQQPREIIARSHSALSWQGITTIGRGLWRHRMGVTGVLLTLMPIVSGIFAPIIAPADPTEISLQERLLPPMWSKGGTSAYPLGTDALGRDTLSRLIFGARISMHVGVLGVVFSGIIGVVLGLIAGYSGGKVDEVIMRVVDIQLSVPYVALAMVMVAIVGTGLDSIVITLGTVGWVLYGRIVRAETLSIRQRDYVLAARATGASSLRILVRHILPNVMPHIVIIATFGMATMITLEASLSFLGLGVQPPTATWGRMIADARRYINVDIWQPTLPGLALMATLLGINLFGDWLRDMWDPRLRGVK